MAATAYWTAVPGRWIAYRSNESGQYEVCVRTFPDVDAGRWLVSTDGGSKPRWASDGDELFYLGTRSMMSVSIDSESPFAPGAPKSLFDLEAYVVSSPYGQLDGTAYDVTADRNRFLMLKSTRRQESGHLVMVENWFTELERLVPKDQ